MNWKQLYTAANRHERLEIMLHMLQAIQTPQRRLASWQKRLYAIAPIKLIIWSNRASTRIETTLDAMALEPWYWLQRHITNRRAKFAYYYPAHWVG